ncbi:hypothetical protein SLEP1_g59992, partial [Rubroshorea leprosula]
LDKIAKLHAVSKLQKFLLFSFLFSAD